MFLRLARSGLAAVLLCGGLASTAEAHPGGHAGDGAPGDGREALRVWTLTDGGFHLHASFVCLRDDEVQLRREDGILTRVRLSLLSAADRAWAERQQAEIRRLNETPRLLTFAPAAAPAADAEAPAIRRHFAPFEDTLGLRWDDRFFYVESNGLPDHPLMVGIRAWQQQVPLPQAYTGDNAWRIPLHPRPAEKPLSARTGFFRGAIALAVNGVPIFNPIKNDGRTDTFLAGELDEYGGHCGRADDYHYHLPPVHLQTAVGAGAPIGYALDGYPLYGYQDPEGADFAPLDELNGHAGPDGEYHYHATKEYPYLNGGFHGEVVERDGQVDPQPRARGLRPALTPLRGATITGFSRDEETGEYRLVYDLNGESREVRYTLQPDGGAVFVFDDGSDGERRETYRAPSSREGGPPPGDRPPPRGDRPPPPGDRPPGSGGPAPRDAGAGPPRDAPAGARRPWLEVHAGELDADQDGALTREELLAEARRVFAALDAEKAGKLAISAIQAAPPVRSPLGGFVRQHAAELDRDADGQITEAEMTGELERMFEKADREGQGRLPAPPPTAGADRPPPPGDRPSAGPAPAGERPQLRPAPPADGAARGRPPNFILILADDLGAGEVGFAGHPFIETPRLDGLARAGLQFAQAYANAPNCAPTRACLLSGQYPPRHGVYTVLDPRHDPGQPQHRLLAAESREDLPPETVTLAELLRERGYATACCGMWNLGRGRSGPATATGQGFDVACKPQDLGFAKDAYVDAAGRDLTAALVDEGLRFIEAHRDRPFFLYLPLHAVHAPFDPPAELLARYRAKAERPGAAAGDPLFAATVESVDREVGRLVDRLEDWGLAKHTLCVLTSDNGGEARRGGALRGGKGSLYEGGLRVPCLAWGAGVAAPGRTTATPVLSMDFCATFAELAGAAPPADQPLDGVSLGPLLADAGAVDRAALFWHFPCYTGGGTPGSAVRAGDWKLIEHFEGPRIELYDLASDPGETRDLAAREPERARALHARLREWQDSVGAPRPSQPNPAYDSAQLRRGGS